MMVAATVSESSALARYVPRQSAEWDLYTDRRWREVEGTLCYIDISGFTALSEKLAQRGRIGAEELTDALNHVFGSMLAIAYDRGGSLLKFGGDALLLLFSAADHAVQACSAAVEMQGALRAAAEHRTSAGRLRLKMSIGIHTGTVHLFRVGESHRELILTGPAASTTTEMEETAEAGEILVSEATKALLPRGSATARKGGGWLLKWRAVRAEGCGWSPRIPVPSDTIAGCVPTALRAFLEVGAAEPEHHLATVGFIRFTGVDQLMERGGPPAVAEALDELIRCVQAIAHDEGVTFLATDIDTDGGKIILAAGVPGVQEDDEGRLLRTARRITRDPLSLPVKIGVNQGHVFVGEIGTDFRATYTVMGDTVNLAARLMAASSPGEVYAGTTALDNSLTLFHTTALEPFHVKGKARPVQAYAVGSRAGRRPVERGGELPFVGRSVEVARLEAAVDELRRGSGGAVTIVGEQGIGKSRLVDEIRSHLNGVQHIEVRAEPYGTNNPYRPLRDPVRRLLGVERADPATMGRQLRAGVAAIDPDLLPYLPLIADVAIVSVPSTPVVDDIDPQFRQGRTAETLGRLLTAALDEPVLFEVEDGHHMDEASCHVVAAIAELTAEQPWLLLTTRRDEAGGFDPPAEQLRLAPLADDDARSLIHAATEAAPLRPQDVDAIVERAAGLPLFIEELVRAARIAGGVGHLPASLDAVVSAQIDALPPLTRRLLMFASVLGRSFRVEMLNHLVAEEAVSLDAATRRDLAGFIEGDGPGRVRFRHALIRDSAYSGLSFQRRRSLHLRAGEAAEREAGDHPETAADVLALHFSLANDHARAWRYCRMAGDQAAAAYANIDAATHYERALEAARRLHDIAGADQARVWTSLGDVRERAGRFEDAHDAYRRASALVDDPLDRVDLLLRRAMVRRRAGAYRSALRETAIGLSALSGETSVRALGCRARLNAERAAIRRWQQRPAEALRLASRAEHDARACGDRETLGRALDLVHWAHRMTGRTDLVAPYAEILAIYEEINDLDGVAQVWNNLGADAFYRGNWREAIDAYRRSAEASRRAGNDVLAAISDTNIAELLINQRRFDEAEPLLVETLRVLRAANHLPAVAFAETELARLYLRRGDLESAVPLLREIHHRSSAAGEALNVLTAGFLLAECAIAAGDAGAGLDQIRVAEADAGELAEMFGPTIGRIRATALGALGRVEEALRHIDAALDQAREQGLVHDQALLLDARRTILAGTGRAIDHDEREAGRLFDELDIRRQPTHAH